MPFHSPSRVFSVPTMHIKRLLDLIIIPLLLSPTPPYTATQPTSYAITTCAATTCYCCYYRDLDELKPWSDLQRLTDFEAGGMASRVFGGRAFDLVQEAAQNTANAVAGAASQVDILADTQSDGVIYILTLHHLSVHACMCSPIASCCVCIFESLSLRPSCFLLPSHTISVTCTHRFAGRGWGRTRGRARTNVGGRKRWCSQSSRCHKHPLKYPFKLECCFGANSRRIARWLSSCKRIVLREWRTTG